VSIERGRVCPPNGTFLEPGGGSIRPPGSLNLPTLVFGITPIVTSTHYRLSSMACGVGTVFAPSISSVAVCSMVFISSLR
jgi:hypothetical protein